MAKGDLVTIIKDDIVLAKGIDGPCRVCEITHDRVCQIETQSGDQTWRDESNLTWLGTPKFETVFIVADNKDIFEPFKTSEEAKKYIGDEIERFAITRVRVQMGYLK